jgi:hypothetical protein
MRERTRGVAALAATFGCSTALVLWLAGGWGALAYVVAYALAVLPGLPLGFALFGRHHPAAWIGGALLGYGLTQMTIWAVIVLRIASVPAFISAWLVLVGVTVIVSRRIPVDGAQGQPAWSAPDWRALLVVLLLVPALMGPPYANLGRADAEGNRYYRAYFTADFVWHSALAFELGRFTLPPRNPYLAPRVMNYYWTYFLLPATVAELSTASLTGQARAPASDEVVQRCLKANAILSGMLMIGALFLLVRSAVPTAWPAAIAVVLAVVAASAEGTYAVLYYLSDGLPLAALQDTNIDAITAWHFDGLRIDNVPRSLWYTPQHTTAAGLGLIGWLIAVTAGTTASLPVIAGAGLALGLATTVNPLLGACFSLVYGAVIVFDAFRVPHGWRLVPRHAIAAIPVVLAIAWGYASRVMDGAGAVLEIGLTGVIENGPIVTLLLSLGPILLPALAGLRPFDFAQAKALDSARGRPFDFAQGKSVALACAGILLGLFLLYCVRISEGSWVGFRAGQILLISIPVLLARTLASLGPRVGAALATLILIAGLPTTLIDTWNAQDISNRRPGPGFRWTLWVTPDQQQMFAWIRAHTPRDAVVQMEPMVRGREHWTLIPSFAGRRMAGGLPISLLPLPEYPAVSEVIKVIYATTNADEASRIARRLRIDYLYVDGTDTEAYVEGVGKFDAHPALFTKVFSSGDARLYRVN